MPGQSSRPNGDHDIAKIAVPDLRPSGQSGFAHVFANSVALLDFRKSLLPRLAVGIATKARIFHVIWHSLPPDIVGRNNIRFTGAGPQRLADGVVCRHAQDHDPHVQQ